MIKCPKCGAPAGPGAPDGDFRYRPPMSDAPIERARIRKLALEPSEEMAQRIYDRINDEMPLPGLANPNGASMLLFGVLFLRAFAEEIGG